MEVKTKSTDHVFTAWGKTFLLINKRTVSECRETRQPQTQKKPPHWVKATSFT